MWTNCGVNHIKQIPGKTKRYRTMKNIKKKNNNTSSLHCTFSAQVLIVFFFYLGQSSVLSDYKYIKYNLFNTSLYLLKDEDALTALFSVPNVLYGSV